VESTHKASQQRCPRATHGSRFLWCKSIWKLGKIVIVCL